ncbi:nucleotide sugar dehydrogenase [archaeon]
MKVCVVGLGWMGLPIAALFSEGGNEVTGLDVNAELVERINKLDIQRDEAGLKEILEKHPIKATTNPEEAIPDADAIVIIVPLIVNDDKSINYSIIDDAVSKAAEHMKDGALVVMETTMPIGACRKRVAPILEKSGKQFLLAYAPIRAMSRSAIGDMREKYSRILGALDDESMQKAEELMKTFFKNEIIKLPLEEAEAVKLYEVVYRDVNIALANELGMISEELGLDYRRVKEAANSCGYYHLHDTGIGVGGHCLPVYPYLILNEVKKDHGLIRKAREINDHMPQHVAETIEKLGAKAVTIYGVSYRKDTSECRFSPAFELARILKAKGVVVKLCDPNISDESLSRWGEPVSVDGGLSSGVLVFVVGHLEFKGIEAKIPESATVIDMNKVLDEEKIKGRYFLAGRGPR